MTETKHLSLGTTLKYIRKAPIDSDNQPEPPTSKDRIRPWTASL